MSTSKKVMAMKLANVQKRLMERDIESSTVEYLIPLIFKECLKENLTFWFSFLEDCAILNLRDIVHENYELNIRYHYVCAPLTAERIDSVKSELLMNVFLITKKAASVTDAEPEPKKTNTMAFYEIQESNLVPPSAIRVAIELCEKNNEPVTRKNVEKKLELGQMTQEKRRQCIAYLKSMGA